VTQETARSFQWIPIRRFVEAITDGPFGSSLTSEHYSDQGARVVRLGNIGSAQFKNADVAYIPMHYFAMLRQHEVKPGDLIIAGLGDENHPLGRACVAPFDMGPAIVKADCFRIRLDQTRLTHRFAAWALSSAVVAEQISLLARGSTRARINLSVAREIQLPIPTVEEQCRIADFLDVETARIDALVVTHNSMLALLEERRRVGVHAAVTGATVNDRRSSGLAWADSLPSHWQTAKLGLLARMGSGHTPSRSHPEWWIDCKIPWITTGEVQQVRDDRREEIFETRESISELGLANSAAELCPKGTVVLCRTASAGYSGIMGSAMATSQDFVTWQCGPRIDPFYLLWSLRAMRPDLLGRLAMGSTHKTIYVPDLQMLRVAVPPISEQHSIVAAIREQNQWIDGLVATLERQVALLAERRQALISAAVTGQFDVTTAGKGTDHARAR
jgi:type I restriction enzyme S subunit